MDETAAVLAVVWLSDGDEEFDCVAGAAAGGGALPAAGKDAPPAVLG
jgi:hypothetical protein